MRFIYLLPVFLLSFSIFAQEIDEELAMQGTAKLVVGGVISYKGMDVLSDMTAKAAAAKIEEEKILQKATKGVESKTQEYVGYTDVKNNIVKKTYGPAGYSSYMKSSKATEILHKIPANAKDIVIYYEVLETTKTKTGLKETLKFQTEVRIAEGSKVKEVRTLFSEAQRVGIKVNIKSITYSNPTVKGFNTITKLVKGITFIGAPIIMGYGMYQIVESDDSLRGEIKDNFNNWGESKNENPDSLKE